MPEGLRPICCQSCGKPICKAAGTVVFRCPRCKRKGRAARSTVGVRPAAGRRGLADGVAGGQRGGVRSMSSIADARTSLTSSIVSPGPFRAGHLGAEGPESAFGRWLDDCGELDAHAPSIPRAPAGPSPGQSSSADVSPPMPTISSPESESTNIRFTHPVTAADGISASLPPGDPPNARGARRLPGSTRGDPADEQRRGQG